MPRKELSQTAKSLITLLNNVNELVVDSSRRTAAKDVLKAMKIYAQNVRYSIPDELIDDLSDVMLDSRDITITYMIREIATKIAKDDLKQSKCLYNVIMKYIYNKLSYFAYTYASEIEAVITIIFFGAIAYISWG